MKNSVCFLLVSYTCNTFCCGHNGEHPGSYSLLPTLATTQRQVRKSFSDPSPTAKTRLLFFNRTQSRVVTGLPTGHNTLKKHLYLLLGLINSPLCGRCGADEETSAHVLCGPSLRHNYLGFFSWLQGTLEV